MTDTSTTLTYHDPHGFEGEPHEAAAAAAEQASRVAGLSQLAVTDAENLARNAWMTRNLRAGESADAAGWESSHEGEQWALLLRLLAQLPAKLDELSEAAGQKDH